MAGRRRPVHLARPKARHPSGGPVRRERTPAPRGRRVLRLFIGRRVLRACRYAIGWSKESTDIARQLAPGIRVETHPGTGSDADRRRARTVPAERVVRRCVGRHAKLAFVGRFSREKGSEDFLEIADRLAERIPSESRSPAGTLTPDGESWLASRPWARCTAFSSGLKLLSCSKGPTYSCARAARRRS